MCVHVTAPVLPAAEPTVRLVVEGVAGIVLRVHVAEEPVVRWRHFQPAVECGNRLTTEVDGPAQHDTAQYSTARCSTVTSDTPKQPGTLRVC